MERGLAVEITARSEDEERSPERRIPILVCQWDFLPCDVREDDQLDVASRSGARLRSNRA